MEGLAENTVKSINTTVKRLENNVGNEWFKFSKSKPYLETVPVKVRKTLVFNAIRWLKHNKKAFKMWENYAGKIVDGLKFDIPEATPKEKECFITREKIGAIYNKLSKPETYEQGLQKIIASFYYHQDPLRGGEVASLSFDNKEPNHIRFVGKRGGMIILKDYKTKSSYGVRKHLLSDKLVKDLNEWKMWREANGLYMSPVIPSPSDFSKPMNTKTFSMKLQQIFGKGVGSSQLRKCYVSELFRNKASALDRKVSAMKMGHSPATQAIVYGRLQ
jgi:integrase